MTSTSPSQRLRTKTSDLTDFFRATSSHGLSQQRPGTSTAAMLEVPPVDEHGGTRKKITRIPLFGRSRKKSNQSATSSPFASGIVLRESNDATLSSQEQPARATSTDHLRPHTSAGNPSSSTATITSKDSSKSFGSKLAAHFGHARRSAQLPPQPPVPATPSILSTSSLSPVPPSKRSGDSESGSSSGSKRRSTTPRPRITVTSDNLERLAASSGPTSKSSRASSQTTINGLPNTSASDDLDTPPPSTTTTSSSRNRSPEPLTYRRGQTPASAIAAAHRKNSSIGGDKPPSVSSRKRSSRQDSDSDKGPDGSGTSTPRDIDLSDPSSRQTQTPTPPGKDKESSSRVSSRRPSLATTTSSHGSDSPTSAMIRSSVSRMKPPTASRSRPPSMPLPLPPTPPTPTTPPPEPPVPLRYLSRSQPPQVPLPRPPSPRPCPSSPPPEPPSPRSLIRPRAHTIGAMTPNNIPALSSTNKAPQPQRHGGHVGPVDVDSLDVDTAPAEQLREALKMRNQHYKDLTAYILKLREDHAAQVASLEKKVASLEREGARREKEIKGLTWIINNGEAPQPNQPGAPSSKVVPPGVYNASRLSPPSAYVDMDSDGKRPSRKPSYQSDSGAESHAESIIASGSGSESVSSVRHKRFRKLYSLGEATASTIGRGVSSSRRSSIVPPSESGHRGSGDATKRSSQLSSSGVPSPSSSTSSLLPPSPSVTMSSLSAIPEGTPSLKPGSGGGGGSGRYDSGSEHGQHDDRRALRAAHRISTSSMASSSTAASSAYSAPVIKRSRPPSIAQVLEKSPNLDDMLDKLRPFA